MAEKDKEDMRNCAAANGKCVRQRTARQQTTMYNAGTLPLNMYETAACSGEKITFSEAATPDEDDSGPGEDATLVEVEPDVQNEKQRADNQDQLSEYSDYSEDEDLDMSTEETDNLSEVPQQPKELTFMAGGIRTRNGREIRVNMRYVQ